jgi:hypothetical protein
VLLLLGSYCQKSSLEANIVLYRVGMGSTEKECGCASCTREYVYFLQIFCRFHNLDCVNVHDSDFKSLNDEFSSQLAA